MYHGKVPAEELVMNMMAIADSKAGLSTADGSGGAVDAELAELTPALLPQSLPSFH